VEARERRAEPVIRHSDRRPDTCPRRCPRASWVVDDRSSCTTRRNSLPSLRRARYRTLLLGLRRTGSRGPMRDVPPAAPGGRAILQ
jgi:hypothetical protein